MRIPVLCSIVFICATSLFAQQETIPSTEFDTYITNVMKEFQVPGIGLAIVKDGKIVLTKGYGIRTLNKSNTVDEHTLFGIASNTKAFTATAIGLLVEEGKIEWDAPVVKYLPWFQLSNPYVTRELTVRDLLVHRSGLSLGAGDLLWWPPSTYTRKEISQRLASIPLSTSFRSAYAYDNVLYLVAGELIEAVSGTTWEDFITKRILRPLGMTDCRINSAPSDMSGNVATTHAIVDDQLQIVVPFTGDNVNPAAGINASAADIAKWMVVQLDSGRLADGSKLFSQRTTRALWSLVTPIPVAGDPLPEAPFLRPSFYGYALGFNVRDFRGHEVVSHTGGLPGYVSRLSMIPDIKLGIAVFTNQESGDAFNAITYHVIDHYLHAPPFDWLALFKKFHTEGDSSTRAAERAAQVARDSLSHPSLPLVKYAGTYHDAWYGDIVITQENNRLAIRFEHTPSLIGYLDHWQYDTFIARWKERDLRADAYVTFSLTPEGAIDHAIMKAFSPATDFSFDFQDLFLKPVAKK